jgi:hypothetical protein
MGKPRAGDQVLALPGRGPGLFWVALVNSGMILVSKTPPQADGKWIRSRWWPRSEAVRRQGLVAGHAGLQVLLLRAQPASSI